MAASFDQSLAFLALPSPFLTLSFDFILYFEFFDYK